MGLEGGARLLIELKSRSRKMAPYSVEAGFFNAELASIAYFNEYGFYNVRHNVQVPPRPFMRLASGWHREEWIKRLRTQLRIAKDIRTAFDHVGRVMASDINRTMSASGLFLPNKPLTVENKGFNKPLIGPSARMFKAVAWRVKRVRR